MIVKRRLYDYQGENIGANKQIFAVIGFKEERNQEEGLKSFKIDHWTKEEYEIVKSEFNETEDVFYVKRLDSDLPISLEYLESRTLWIPGFDMTTIMENGFSLSDTYENLDKSILKELEILNNK